MHTVTAAESRSEFELDFFFDDFFQTCVCVFQGLAKRVGARLLLASTSEVYGGKRDFAQSSSSALFLITILSFLTSQVVAWASLATWSALVPSCFSPFEWACNLHLVPFGCCITLCSGTLVPALGSSLKALFIFSHTETAPAEQRGDLFKVSFQQRNIFMPCFLFFLPLFRGLAVIINQNPFIPVSDRTNYLYQTRIDRKEFNPKKRSECCAVPPATH